MWSDDKAVAIGGGDKFGLYIYNDFTHGKTEKCTTFDNNPLTTVEFNIDLMEVWGTLLDP